MNRIHEAYSPTDEVYYSQHVSALLTINGERVYLVKSYDDYLALKRQHTVTRRIQAMDLLCPGLYFCDMIGSDGSLLTIHLTEDDLHHNLMFAESQAQISNCAMVC